MWPRVRKNSLTDPAGEHAGDAEYHVAGIRGRLVVRDLVDDFIAEFALQRVKGDAILVEAFKVGNDFLRSDWSRR